MGSANTNSSIMGRQRNNVNVAMNNDMGELQIYESLYRYSQYRDNALDASNTSNGWKRIKHATENCIAS
jgi:hypothetical protein